MSFITNFWWLIVESAPWLLAGYFLAGVINELIPGSWVKRQLAGSDTTSIVKGALIGAPLPLCSCGVIPTAVAIRKAGASKGSTASFLVATPETGVDSVAFSYAVLGPIYAIVRPLAAISSAITTGLLVNFSDRDESVVEEEAHSCCNSNKNADNDEHKPVSKKITAALVYGYDTMIDDTAKWLLIGFIAAAAVTTWVPESFFTSWGTGIGAMLIMVIVGLPMYICATASTPIAASFLFAGISPGAALVFLLTGPATNVATMGIVKQHLGIKSLLAYIVGVISCALVWGFLLNYIVAFYGISFANLDYSEHQHFAIWQQVAACVLLVLIVRILLIKLIKFFKRQQHELAEQH